MKSSRNQIFGATPPLVLAEILLVLFATAMVQVVIRGAFLEADASSRGPAPTVVTAATPQVVIGPGAALRLGGVELAYDELERALLADASGQRPVVRVEAPVGHLRSFKIRRAMRRAGIRYLEGPPVDSAPETKGENR